MSTAQADRLLSTGQVAAELRENVDRVRYVISRDGIEPRYRCGRWRLFDTEGINAVREALGRTERRY